jgi:hypothetical protein
MGVMPKFLLIFAALLSVAMDGCVGFAPDLFTPFMQGSAAAQRANEYDRQQAITYDINYFNKTGDYRALCHAAMLGSGEAANHLRKNRIGCRTYELSGQKFIQAVHL